MMSRTRRNFIKTASATVAGAIISPNLITASSAPDIKSGELCAFTKCLQFLDYDRLGETLAMLGFDGADLTVRKKGHVLPENIKVDLPRAVKALQKSGVRVPMMVTGIVDPEDPETELVLGTASGLGIKYYRMGYLLYKNNKTITENLDEHKRSMEKLAGINRKYGIQGCYQNHPGVRVGSSLWDLHWILKDCNPEDIGVQYDIGQAVMEGSESWPLDMKLLSPWIRTTVMKDFVWNNNGGKWAKNLVPLGDGMVDFDAYFKNYSDLKISGPITIHYEYELGGAEAGSTNPTISLDEILAFMRDDLEWLKKQLKAHNIT